MGDVEALQDVAEAHRSIDRSIEDPAADTHGRRGIRIHLDVNQLGFEADAPLPQSCPEDTVAVIHRRFERGPGKRHVARLEVAPACGLLDAQRRRLRCGTPDEGGENPVGTGGSGAREKHRRGAERCATDHSRPPRWPRGAIVPPHLPDLLVADGVIHAGIQHRVHVPTHLAEHVGGFLDSPCGDVRFDVAAAEEHGRVVERSCLRPDRARRTDEPTAQSNECTVTPRVAHGELQREAGPLREPEQRDAHRRHPGPFDLRQRVSEAGERRREPRLVRLSGREEPVGYQVLPLACGAR